MRLTYAVFGVEEDYTVLRYIIHRSVERTGWTSLSVGNPLVFGTSYPVFNQGGFQVVRCPLWVKSGHPTPWPFMSAFGGKADINHCVGECPLLAISGHPHSVAQGLARASKALLFGVAVPE